MFDQSHCWKRKRAASRPKGIGDLPIMSTASNRAAAINRAGGKYHVAVQGIDPEGFARDVLDRFAIP